MRTAPPIHSLKFYATLVLSSFVLLASAFLLQNLDRPQELRSQAEEGATTPTVAYRITTSPTTPQVGEELTLNFQINTNGLDISGIELRRVDITAPEENAALFPETLTNSLANKFNPFVNTLSGTQLNYLVTLTNPGAGFSTTTYQTFATLTFTPAVAGDITFTYDPDYSIVTEFNGTANLLPFPESHTITVTEAATGDDGSECVDNNDVCDADSCAYDAAACDASKDDDDGGEETNTSNDKDTGTQNETTSCTTPAAPDNVKARAGEEPGEIRVSWLAPADTDHYAVSFGRQSRNYQYGSPDIGNVREFYLRYLEPGRRYYIVVAAVNDCGSSPYSLEVAADAAADPNANTTTVTTTTTTTSNPPTTPPTPKPTPQIIGISKTGEEVAPKPAATPTPTPSAKNYPERPPTADKNLLQRLIPYLFGLLIAGLLGVGAVLIYQNRRTAKLIKPNPLEHKITPQDPSPKKEVAPPHAQQLKDPPQKKPAQTKKDSKSTKPT